jgi:aminoglycoside phosphotransferase
VSFVTPGLVLK